ncbi:MAG TPA: methyltransferase domain-containing protein [Terriglobales bacterium]|nr:methyltransferase domain-containing protein [Terriglobales bacterium]
MLSNRFSRRWSTQGDFSPEDLGGFSWLNLVLVSVLSLFLELLMIRWISSEIRIFAYFKNFVLIACFLGFGLGCYLSRRRINLFSMLVPLVVLTLFVNSPIEFIRSQMAGLPAMLGASSQVQVWGVPYMTSDAASLASLVSALLICALLFVLIGFIFIPIGQMVGWYLENAPKGIAAYSVNVLASLVGITLYTLLCFWYQPPIVWFVLAGATTVLLLVKTPKLAVIAAGVFALICVVISITHPQSPTHVYWSPYQKLTLTPQPDADHPETYQLSTNDSWYQKIVNLSPEFVRAHSKAFKDRPVEWNAYNIPYKFYPSPQSVLVLGAGMGNDTAAALRNGAGHVVAVEIDPLIVKLGRELHFEKPYDSPRVHVVLNDARNYIQNSNERFDLIVFSLLDSHTTSSYYSNIRIDNYVYTVQALTAARRLLRPGGLFIVKFQVSTTWIAGRLDALLKTVFGQEPVQLLAQGGDYETGGSFFIVGAPERLKNDLADPAIAEFLRGHTGIKMRPASLTTDDWPYFYQREPGLPLNVILLSLMLLAICGWFIGSTAGGVRNLRWHFFFLGGGFLLLEAQIISKMALLFGTTWVVNSIVISALLLLIVCANCVVQWWEHIPFWLAYLGIFISFAVTWLIPLNKFFFHSVALKATVAALVLCSPVFFAGVIFVRSFARAGFSGKALGSNLFGALVGGLLESLSFWFGLKALLVIAAFLYLASALALRLEVDAAVTVKEPEGQLADA